jgi:hypothetical protein
MGSAAKSWQRQGGVCTKWGETKWDDVRMSRVGQNRVNTPYIAVCMVISLLRIPYVHRIYV